MQYTFSEHFCLLCFHICPISPVFIVPILPWVAACRLQPGDMSLRLGFIHFYLELLNFCDYHTSNLRLIKQRVKNTARIPKVSWILYSTNFTFLHSRVIFIEILHCARFSSMCQEFIFEQNKKCTLKWWKEDPPPKISSYILCIILEKRKAR